MELLTSDVAPVAVPVTACSSVFFGSSEDGGGGVKAGDRARAPVGVVDTDSDDDSDVLDTCSDDLHFRNTISLNTVNASNSVDTRKLRTDR